jgi:hypothetical protein
VTIPIEIQHLLKREAVNLKKQKLKIKGMRKGTYQIDYYLPENQVEPIFTSVQSGRNIDIDLPSIAATNEGYIVLFRVGWHAKR